MKSLAERVSEIRDDPVKLKRVFTLIWVASYSMLVLGGFIIIWALLYGM
ncbi:MAG: hypothetical protein SPJ57_06440 [Candidatus Methanomethylophilaceae archaeon]|nr:hypothetical protein [Candidatus Methanomethylophilaceae archaeon]